MSAKKVADIGANLPAIITLGRIRYDFQRDRVAMSNGLAAMARKYDGPKPQVQDIESGLGRTTYTTGYEGALEALASAEKKITKDLADAVKQCPAAARFTKETRGIDAAGVGMLLALVGDPRDYPKPSSLWHYAGEHVVDGRAPRRRRGIQLAGLNSYNPHARTVVYRQAVAATKTTGPLQDLYKRVRAEYVARPRTGPSECPFGHVHDQHDRRDEVSADGVAERRKTGSKSARKCFNGEKSAHVHAASLRRVSKELLRQLWCAFNPKKAAAFAAQQK